METTAENKQKKILLWISIILAIALIAAIAWSVSASARSNELSLKLENQYNRAFHEMTGYIDDIETLLNKGMLVSSAGQLASISSDIFRQSAAAKACLGQLPTSEVQLDNTSKFLSQVGDYTYVLSQNMINGGTISDEDYKNLASMTEYAAQLSESLTKMQDEIYAGNIDFTPGKPSANTVQAEGGLLTDLENVEKSFEEYPSLIYDGPFSEHIENRESAMLRDAKEISMDEARAAAEKFLGDKAQNLSFESDTQNSAIDAYTFTASPSDDEQISISIAKKGGYVVYYLNNRSIGSESIDFSEAVQKASEYLQSKGFYDMENNYYDKSGGIATINFAYMQDGVTCYSDLVKVKVALDNGEILGLEANGYLMNHTRRSFPAKRLSSDEAKQKLNKHLSINSISMAYIPKDSLEEILCYEFQGKFKDKNFIIYINAENGREEKILMLIESADGILTV